MKFKNIYIGAMIALLSFTFVGCEDDIDPLVNELELSRALTPIEVVARIRNQTTIEVDWSVRDDADHYVVEFSEDSLEFNTIIRTVTVQPGDLPVSETFFGDTRYSARVKAISADGVADSKWAAVTIRTASENIFLPVENANIGIDEVTVKWPAGGQATRFVINPGNVERAITAQEVADGEATITGLDYYTNYTVTMYSGNSQRGFTAIKTLMDPDCPTCVKLNPGDNLATAVTNAANGAILVLAAGTYPNQGSIAIDKSITIQGAVYYDKPVVYARITCATTVNSIAVIGVVFRGDATSTEDQFFNTVSGCNLSSLLVEDSEIRNYNNNFIYNNASGIFGAIKVVDSYVHSIPGGGGDGIDFRNGTIGSLTVENSTFANGFRTFLRMQLSCNASFKNCTFYKVSGLDNSNNNGLFRMSGGGSFEVSGSLFVETGLEAPTQGSQVGNFCRQASYMVASPAYANNNIHSCHNLLVGLYTSATQVAATEIDPGFVDPANGDFTVTNQTIIDSKIGDPRWLP